MKSGSGEGGRGGRECVCERDMNLNTASASWSGLGICNPIECKARGGSSLSVNRRRRQHPLPCSVAFGVRLCCDASIRSHSQSTVGITSSSLLLQFNSIKPFIHLLIHDSACQSSVGGGEGGSPCYDLRCSGFW